MRRDDSDVVRSLQTLAWALRNQEQYDEALALLQRALRLHESKRWGETMCGWGRCWTRCRRRD